MSDQDLRSKDWADYFIRLAWLVSLKSKDPSTSVGCVIVDEDNAILTTGFNGFARGVQEYAAVECPKCSGSGTFFTRSMESLSSDYLCPTCGGVGKVLSEDLHPQRWQRPEKYDWVTHAEANAVFNAARIGARLKGATAYFNFEPACPCPSCADALIQSGVMRWVGPDTPFPNPVKRDIVLQKVQEAGVELFTVRESG